MKTIVLLMAASALFATVSCSNAGNESTDSVEVAEEKNEQRADSLNRGDGMEVGTEFLAEAASGGLMEVQLGELASKTAASPDVKAFGQMMVTDHSKANGELKSLAESKNIAIPSTPGSEHQEHINTLKNEQGAAFDKAYMSMMVDDHQEDVEKFQAAAQNANDPAIKAFAEKHVPILQQHLQRAKAIHEKLN